MVSKSVEVKVPIIGSVHMKYYIWVNHYMDPLFMHDDDDDAVGKSVSTRAE